MPLLPLEIGLFTAFLSLFIDYTLKPGEIFFEYTFILAKNRLKQEKIWEQYQAMIDEAGKTKEVKRIIYEAASEYFTWEKAIGMCVICTGFWISLICGIFYTLEVAPLIEIVLISHVSLRILTKIL